MIELHLTRDLPPRTNGGISTAVGTLLDSKSARGIRCAALSFDGYRPRDRSPCPPLPSPSVECGAEVVRVSHPGQLGGALAWARDLQPETTFCHHDLLWEASVSVGSPTRVLVVHVLQRAQNRLRGVAETMSSRAQDAAVGQAHRVIAPSRAARDVLAGDYPGADVEVEPLLVPVREVVPESRDSIVYVGRFSDLRGLGDLIAALPALFEGARGARLVIAGGCPDNPKAERRWRRQIAESGVDVEVPGWLGPQEVHQLLCRARVAVVPSWIETFGMTACEAMLAEAAVVASDIPALRELCGGDAEWIPPRDPVALASRAVALWSEPDRAAAMGRRARARILASPHALSR